MQTEIAWNETCLYWTQKVFYIFKITSHHQSNTTIYAYKKAICFGLNNTPGQTDLNCGQNVTHSDSDVKLFWLFEGNNGMNCMKLVSYFSTTLWPAAPKQHYQSRFIQGDSGGICNTLRNDSMCDSKQISSYEHGSDFERLPRYGKKMIGPSCEHEQQLRNK